MQAGLLNKDELRRNFKAAFLSQGISMLLSIITSLVVPKVLGVTQFGYWQLFTFYMSYTVYALLGVADGIYLKEGGKKRNEISCADTSGQYLVSLCVQTACATLIVVYALSVEEDGGERAFVFVCVVAMLFLQCAVTYLSWIFQAVNEPRIYSHALMANRIVFFLMLVPLLTLRVGDYRWYVGAFILAEVVMLVYCVRQGKDFIFHRPCDRRRAVRLFASNAKTGLFLSVAVGASTFSLGIVRLFVDATQPIEVFSVASLALSLVTFILSFIAQVGMVLFPALRRANEGERVGFYGRAKELLSLFLPLMYLCYWPLRWVIGWWLPDYAASFELFLFLIPICVFDSKMQMVFTTYFKVLRMERVLFAINLSAVLLCAVLALVSLCLLESLQCALLGLTVSYIVRSIVARRTLDRAFGCKMTKADAGEVFVTAMFLSSTLFLQPIASIVITACSCLLSIIVSGRDARRMMKGDGAV